MDTTFGHEAFDIEYGERIELIRSLHTYPVLFHDPVISEPHHGCNYHLSCPCGTETHIASLDKAWAMQAGDRHIRDARDGWYSEWMCRK